MNTNLVTCCYVNDSDRTVTVERAVLVPRASVYAIVRKDEYHLLMIRGTTNGRLTLPGGGVSNGEPYGAALSREVGEETGLKVSGMKYWAEYENFVYFEAEDTYWRIYLEIFTCEIEDLETPLTNAGNPDDEGTPEWVDLRTVRREELQNIFGDIVQFLQFTA